MAQAMKTIPESEYNALIDRIQELEGGIREARKRISLGFEDKHIDAVLDFLLNPEKHKGKKLILTPTPSIGEKSETEGE